MQAATVSAQVESPASAAFAVFPASGSAAPSPDPPAGVCEPAEPPAQRRSEMEPRHGSRRYAHGELLLAAFIGARRPLTFEDLAGVLVGTGARVSELVTWMATSRANGLIVSQGFELDPVGIPVGPRLFTLSEEARGELRARRDRRRPRVAA